MISLGQFAQDIVRYYSELVKTQSKSVTLFHIYMELKLKRLSLKERQVAQY